MNIKKLTAFIIVSALLLIGFIAFSYKTDTDINAENIELINKLGRQVEEKCCDISYFAIPEEFDSAFSAYNQSLMKYGFDLTPYKGARVTGYIYSASDSSRPEYIRIIRYKGKIISADIPFCNSHFIPFAVTK